MKKMKRSESRDRVLDNSAYFKPDEKQMLTPLNEENHFKRNVRIIQGRSEDFSKGGSHCVKHYRHGVFVTEYCRLFP